MKHQILDEDIGIVTEVLKSEYLTQGPHVQQVEESMAKLTKRKFGVMCSNGTAALHMAYEAIKLKKNDVVIMPVINFIAAYNMASLYKTKIYYS